MKRNTLKKAVAFVLAMTLVTGGMPVNVPCFLTGGTEIVARAELGNVTYLDADGTTQTCTDYNVVNSTNGVKAGWNVVSGTVELGWQSLSGDINIILCDNAKLTVTSTSNAALSLSSGNLTIYAQSTGSSMGELVASSTNNYTINTDSGKITINGGKVTATANGSDVTSRAIAAWGNVTINGGIINATGYYYGIYSSNNVEINGGTVTAQGTSMYAAFGKKIKNTIPGIGWADAAGTGDGTAIAVSAEGQSSPSYMKVHFEAPSHTHNFTSYTADGDTITATCSTDDCPLDDGTDQHNHTAKLTIAAPPHTLVFDENDANAVITDAGNIKGNAVVSYYATDTNGNKTGEALTEAPTAEGKYWAEITLGEGDVAKTAHVVYDITNPEYNITFPTNLENGTVTAKIGETVVTKAHYGDTVTLVATPNDGYALNYIRYKKSGGLMTELDGSGNTRTFTMPADNVTISADFREKKNTGVTLNTTGTGGTSSLMKNDYSELTSTDKVTEGEKFILCVNRDENSDFNITNSDVSMTEFTKDEYENFIVYAKQNNISVLPDTVLAWVTMPYVAEGDLNLNVNFAKRHTFTVLYQPTGSPENVWCKFAVNSGVEGTQTGSELMKSDAVMADGTKVFSMKVTSAFDPSQIAFVTAENELESATMTGCSTATSTSNWSSADNGTFCVIGGDAKTAIAAFVTDPSATKVYKDNALDPADEDAAADGVTYRLAVVTDGNAGTVTAPAAPTAPTGKTFVGWRGFEGTAPNLTEKIYKPGDSISVSGNTTLNAVWKPITLSVKLNLNGGTGGSDNITVTYDKLLTISENPTREGYVFDGWTVGKTVTEDGKLFAKGTPFDLSTNITADLELTAQWKHEHSYSCYQISQFPALAAYKQYESAVHIAVCGCNDVKLVAHEFDSNGKCACGYQIPTSDDATLEISYGKMSESGYNAMMAGMPETAKKNQEVSIYAPTTWGNLEFSKWVYSTNGTNWYDLTADAYASFLIPCNMQVRALYVNPVENPQVELFARPYDDQAVVGGQTYIMDSILFQMNYKLPDGCTFVDAGIRMGDNNGISYYELKERTYTYDTTGKAFAIGVAVVTSILDGGINTVDLSATDTYYAERENSVLDEMSPATLAKYMYESKPINVEKYDPIYWEAKAKTKGMSGSINTLPPLRFAQKDNQNHWIYGIGWLRYKDSSGNIKTIYTDALPATVNHIPSNPVTKSGS